jgi:hypothetical protein
VVGRRAFVGALLVRSRVFAGALLVRSRVFAGALLVPSRVFVAALLVVGLGLASQGHSQVSPPSCPAGAVAQPTFSASDLDELGSARLVATHTIQVTTDFGSTLVDDGSVAFSLPAGATAIRPHGDVTAGPDGVLFTARAAGALIVTARWTQDDGAGGKCAGSASTTLQLRAATRMPRLKDARALEHLHPNLKFDLLWRYGTDLGPNADLDPVTIMARGVSRPRLPGAKVPFKTVTVPLRVGDPGSSGDKQRHISLPRWIVTMGCDHSAFYVDGDAQHLPMTDVPLGYEVMVFQSGRLLAHLRLAGHCNSTVCDMQTVKVQLT